MVLIMVNQHRINITFNTRVNTMFQLQKTGRNISLSEPGTENLTSVHGSATLPACYRIGGDAMWERNGQDNNDHSDDQI